MDEFLAEFQCQTHLAEGTGHCTWDFLFKKKTHRLVWREESVPVPGLSPFVGLLVGFLLFVVYFFEKTWDPGWQTKDAWKRLCFSKKKNLKKMDHWNASELSGIHLEVSYIFLWNLKGKVGYFRPVRDSHLGVFWALTCWGKGSLNPFFYRFYRVSLKHPRWLFGISEPSTGPPFTVSGVCPVYLRCGLCRMPWWQLKKRSFCVRNPPAT